MKLRNLLFLAILTCIVFVGSIGGAHAAVKYFWQIALEEIENSMQHEYAKKFAQVIEEQSKGEIRCNIHYYGKLGTSHEITELLQKGDLQFAFQSPGHVGSYVHEAQVFSIHFLFPPDLKQIEKILRYGPNTRNTLQTYYRKNRLELLSIIEEGWQIWTANKPLLNPSDFQGITFRVMSSPLLITAYRLYGAYVVTTPYEQIYNDLSLGAIDAETQPYFAIQEMKFYEVQDYMIQSYHLPFIGTFAANYQFIKGLPQNVRDIINNAATAADDYIFSIEPQLNEKRRQMILATKPSMKLIELSAPEIDVFRKKSEPLREKYLQMGGEGAASVLDAVIKDIEWAKQN